MLLNDDNLARANVAQPVYNRNTVSAGIVHLGIGAFHRAHQAVYVDDLLAEDPLSARRSKAPALPMH